MSGFIDIGLFRGLVTAVLFVCFCLIVLWAYSSRRTRDFDEAAQLPFDDGGDDDLNNGIGTHRD